MALQAFTLVPANLKDLMEITPKNTHVYPSPITRTMLRRPQDPPDPEAVVVQPTTTSLDPATAKAGTGDIVMTVYGTAFTPASVVQFGGVAQETDFVSPGSLQVTMQASKATAGTVSVTVKTAALTSTPALTFTYT